MQKKIKTLLPFVFIAVATITACSKVDIEKEGETSELSVKINTSEEKEIEQIQKVEKLEEVETNKTLDLSTSLNAQLSANGEEDFSETEALPNLFQSEAEEKKYSVSGKPIRDETNPNYMNSLQGAEVSVDVKLP